MPAELARSAPFQDKEGRINKGTRLPAMTIVDNHDYGMTPAEIVEQFGVSEDQVKQILDYARRTARPRAPSAARP